MHIYIFLYLLFGTYSHDVQVAFYNIQHVDHQLVVKFDFEQKHILNAFEKLPTDKVTGDELKSYLHNNFTISVNDNEQELSYHHFDIDDNHILITATTSKNIDTVESLEIANTCLLNIENHSNIIEVRLLDQERDFLMNIHRTIINVTY